MSCPGDIDDELNFNAGGASRVLDWLLFLLYFPTHVLFKPGMPQHKFFVSEMSVMCCVN